MDLSKAGVAGKSQTGPHLALLDIIRIAGFRYIEEYLVTGPNKANYALDFYLPEFHVGAEADGPQHKKDKDQIRDRFILETTGILVIRFKQFELRSAQRNISVERLVRFCDHAFYTMDSRKP